MTYNWLNLAQGKGRSWMTFFGCVTPLLNFYTFFKPVPDTVTIPALSHVCQARSPRGIKSRSSSCTGEETSGMGWQKQPRITLARLHRGYPHNGCIHHAGCARVLRRTPVSSYRSTPLTLVPLSDSPSIFIEKSSRLERGLDILYSRSSCQNYPETFRRRPLRSSIAIYISYAFPPCTRDGALTSVDITW